MPPAGRQVETIADVLEALDVIIADAMDGGSRVGYFAAIYRKMTAKIGEGIETGFFDDGARMERLDVGFADRYLQAYEAFRAGASTTRSWARAFEATTSARPIILQHLLLGINAHINLDLGIAAAEVAPGAALPDLRRDFDRVNEIIAWLMGEVASDVAAVSPWIGLLDRLGGRRDDEIIRFSIESARSAAWRFAVELAPLAREDWGGPIGARDASVARLGGVVLNPGLLTFALLLIRARESTDVRRNIELLNRVPAPDLGEVEARVRQERALTD
jgi:Family of unknown function (DUF5995)